MKSIQIFLFAILIFAVSSCAKYPDGTSVMSGGVWIAVAIFVALGLWKSYEAIAGYNSGIVKDGVTVPNSKKRFDVGTSFMAIASFVVALIIYLVAAHNK